MVYTVLEAIRAFEKVTGEKLNYVVGPRRPGDVVAIYANNDYAVSQLGWDLKYTSRRHARNSVEMGTEVESR